MLNYVKVFIDRQFTMFSLAYPGCDFRDHLKFSVSVIAATG
jgi:hypothetical protein